MASKLRRVSLTLLMLYVGVKLSRYLRWRNKLVQLFNVPKSSLPENLIFGNFFDFVKAGGFTETYFKKLHETCGPIAGFFLLPTMFNISVNDPELVPSIFKKAKFRPVETYSFLWFLGDDNLVFSKSEEVVKELRLKYGKMITNRGQLEKVNRIAQKDFGEMYKRWFKSGGKSEVYLDLSARLYDVMGKSLFGEAWLERETGRKIYEHHKYVVENTGKFILFPWLFRPFEYMEFKAKHKNWRLLCKSMLDERRKDIEDDLKTGVQRFKADESALTMIVTDEYFNEHLAITSMCGMLNAGYDTTLSTTFWMVCNLCKYPEEQTKILNEMREKLDLTKEIIDLDDIRNLKYLDAFIKESMRFNSTIPVNQRVHLYEDVTLASPSNPDQHINIPKGINVNIPVFLLMQDKRSFGDDVEVFRPSRFLDEGPQGDIARRAFIQFGAHTRMCVGMTFAFAEIKGLLVSLLRNYRMEFADEDSSYVDGRVEAGVTMPVDQSKVKVSLIQV